MNLDDAELAHPPGHRRRGASRDDRDLDAGAPRGLYGQSVTDVKVLDLLARGAVDEDAVGEDAIHVENQEADPGSPPPGAARSRAPSGHLRLHTILARRISWM